MDYPVQLPCPLRSGYSITPENNIIRTQMVTGRARQRVAYTSIPSYVDLSFIFNVQEAKTFESWAKFIGGDWFNIRLKTPTGYAAHECRFMEVPQGPTLDGGNLWRYKAKAETRNGI